MSERLRRIIRSLILSIAILGLAVLFVVSAKFLRSKPEEKEPARILPRVEALRVQSGGHRLGVVTHGTVQPRTETNLTSEVSGLIVEVSPNFFPGRAFQSGEVLLRLDATEHRSRRADAKSRLSQAKLALEEERAFSEQALEDWQGLGRGEAGDLALRKPQFDRSQAAVEAAQAALDLAERNLRLTEIRAPYAGHIREKVRRYRAGGLRASNAIGPNLLRRRGRKCVYLFRLGKRPISICPGDYGESGSEVEKPTVILEFDYAGKRVTWNGFVDRVEGAIDSGYPADRRYRPGPESLRARWGFGSAAFEGRSIRHGANPGALFGGCDGYSTRRPARRCRLCDRRDKPSPDSKRWALSRRASRRWSSIRVWKWANLSVSPRSNLPSTGWR